jgi:serine phosphatase RsbU (regulator of sigma subunit)
MERLLLLTRRIWPGLERLQGDARQQAQGEILGLLYIIPLDFLGLLWLVAVTEPARLAAHWAFLLLALILLVLFQRYRFFLYVEVAPGRYFDWSTSVTMMLVWSVALVVGPGALWVYVLGSGLFYLRWWGQLEEPVQRLNWARNLSFAIASNVTASLVALKLYARLGGVFPLGGLNAQQVAPAMWAILVRWALSLLLWTPFLGLLFWTVRQEGRTMRPYRVFWSQVLAFDLLVDPFGILAAALWAQAGLGAYLFFFAGVLLASLLAHNLGRAVERGRQRARELGQLEHLGRAFITGAPDLPALVHALEEHAPGMFPYGELEIRLFPDQLLLRHPEESVPVPGEVWRWLEEDGEARSVGQAEPVPWTNKLSEVAFALAPIIDEQTSERIGGIHLRGGSDPLLPVASVIPTSLTALQSLAAQIASALQANAVYQQRLASERVKQELALAAQIQAGFLPTELPQVEGWQWAAVLRSARETSGDFVDWFPLPGSRVGWVVADVADKGMGAALYMAMARTLIRTYASEHPAQPERVLAAVNRRMLQDAQAGLFVSAFFGVLDPSSGRLAYGNAGHNPPLLLRSGGDDLQLLTRTGMVLGVLEDEVWESRSIDLAPGDVLLAYTDGATEAQDAAGDFFGEDRLREAVRANRDALAGEMKEAILTALAEFVGEAPQADDITLLVIKREPTGGPMGRARGDG